MKRKKHRANLLEMQRLRAREAMHARVAKCNNESDMLLAMSSENETCLPYPSSFEQQLNKSKKIY